MDGSRGFRNEEGDSGVRQEMLRMGEGQFHADSEVITTNDMSRTKQQQQQQMLVATAAQVDWMERTSTGVDRRVVSCSVAERGERRRAGMTAKEAILTPRLVLGGQASVL